MQIVSLIFKMLSIYSHSMTSTLFFIIGFIVVFGITLFVIAFLFLASNIEKSEQAVVDIFLQKISKIPALIEVMRPYVVDEKSAFNLMIHLHSEAIIHEFTHIPNIMEHNARINDQYSFLMRLSMAIPELQKNTYFIYIREYLISYDRTMKSSIPHYNTLIKRWNIFVRIKNWTLIWFLFPGREQVEL